MTQIETELAPPPLPSVEDTFKELGYTNMRVLGDRLFVRTHPMDIMYKGTIYIPQKNQDFFGVLPNKHQVWATILSAGPKSILKRGESCTFHRLHFTWWRKMEDGTYTGWVNEANLLGGAE